MVHRCPMFAHKIPSFRSLCRVFNHFLHRCTYFPLVVSPMPWQISWFMAALCLDARRVSQGRLDLAPWMTLPEEDDDSDRCDAACLSVGLVYVCSMVSNWRDALCLMCVLWCMVLDEGGLQQYTAARICPKAHTMTQQYVINRVSCFAPTERDLKNGIRRWHKCICTCVRTCFSHARLWFSSSPLAIVFATQKQTHATPLETTTTPPIDRSIDPSPVALVLGAFH